jgi:arabinogalactan oligomer / maltooligosaccharide transport system substrate-binding protein
MSKKRFGIVGVVAAAAIAVSGLVAPTAYAVDKEITVWADETRGPNLKKVFETKGDWVSGYTVKVTTFSSFDALKTALDNATDLTGPDIIVGANSWVPTGAKNGKLAPITLTSAVRARFTANNFFDLSYKGKVYGVPLDVNNVAMIYNTKLVKSAPKTLGDMVNYYKANKTSKKLTSGLCIAGGGTSWGAHSVLSALGGSAFRMKNGQVVTNVDPIKPNRSSKEHQDIPT